MHHYWYMWHWRKTLQQAFGWYKLSESCRRDSFASLSLACAKGITV